jgi:hypothetical protein
VAPAAVALLLVRCVRCVRCMWPLAGMANACCAMQSSIVSVSASLHMADLGFPAAAMPAAMPAMPCHAPMPMPC